MPHGMPKYKTFDGKLYERQGLSTTKAGARSMARKMKLRRYRIVPFHGMYGLYGK